jgi:3-dehydro-4-phosphotetronate decarboxylase
MRMSADPTATLVQVARDLYLRGLSPGTTGNLSVRLDDAAIAVTPTNGCLGYLDEDALSRIALADGRVLGGLPRRKKHLCTASFMPTQTSRRLSTCTARG